MKKRTIFILGIITVILFGSYWFATHYPRASDELTLSDGTVINLCFVENTLVFLDPEVTKTLTIKTGQFELRHEDWYDNYMYTLLLVKWNGEKYWIIENGFSADFVAPYKKKNAQFKEYYNFDIPKDADTIYHITFDNFKLILN